MLWWDAQVSAGSCGSLYNDVSPLPLPLGQPSVPSGEPLHFDCLSVLDVATSCGVDPTIANALAGRLLAKGHVPAVELVPFLRRAGVAGMMVLKVKQALEAVSARSASAPSCFSFCDTSRLSSNDCIEKQLG